MSHATTRATWAWPTRPRCTLRSAHQTCRLEAHNSRVNTMTTGRSGGSIPRCGQVELVARRKKYDDNSPAKIIDSVVIIIAVPHHAVDLVRGRRYVGDDIAASPVTALTTPPRRSRQR